MSILRIVIRNISRVLLIMMFFYNCSSPSEKEEPGPVEPGVTRAITHSVEIKQMKFFPTELKVKKGDRIVFVNHDMVTHDITEESKKAWNSSPMAVDQTWILVASESVDYYCSIHPVMKGKIVVE